MSKTVFLTGIVLVFVSIILTAFQITPLCYCVLIGGIALAFLGLYFKI